MAKKYSEEWKANISKSKLGKKRPDISESKCHWWKGGKTINNGYVMIRVPEHPFCNHKGYVMKHRLVVEKHINRFLNPKEQVHHKDGNIRNNRFGNLKIFGSNSEHISHHRQCPK